jgi:uncharacterized phage-associated protein
MKRYMIQKIKRIFLEENATHDTSLSIKRVYKMVTAVAYSHSLKMVTYVQPLSFVLLQI